MCQPSLLLKHPGLNLIMFFHLKMFCASQAVLLCVTSMNARGGGGGGGGGVHTGLRGNRKLHPSVKHRQRGDISQIFII